VLILTAQEGKESVVNLLNAGADDYLGKPFDLGELLARIKALIRRAKGVSTPVLAISDLELDTVQQTVRRRGQFLDFPPPNTGFLNTSCIGLVGGFTAGVAGTSLRFRLGASFHVIEAHISNLRRKLNLAGAEPLIETLRHRGYRLARICPLMTGSVSITRRLVVTVLVLELISAVALIVAITVHERHVQLKAFDASLVATAESLMGRCRIQRMKATT